MLFSQTEDYMLAAWKLGTEKKATVDEHRRRPPRSIPSCSTRWVRFLKKKPDNYSALKALAGDGGARRQRGGREEARQGVRGQGRGDQQKRERLEKENEVTLVQVKGPSAFDKDEESKDPFDPLPNGKKRRLNALPDRPEEPGA